MYSAVISGLDWCIEGEDCDGARLVWWGHSVAGDAVRVEVGCPWVRVRGAHVLGCLGDVGDVSVWVGEGLGDGFARLSAAHVDECAGQEGDGGGADGDSGDGAGAEVVLGG